MHTIPASLQSVLGRLLLRQPAARRSGPLRTHERLLAFGRSVALVIATFATFLAIGEILLRIEMHAPLTSLVDMRALRGQAANINSAIGYDPLLGWGLRPFITSQGFNTIEHGFRSNGAGVTVARTGGILAVGSSFTAGSEVVDRETWPAQLERLTGRVVQNAGQGNFSADQIILNAEKLMPIVKPDTIVVDLLADNILGAAYSSYAWPKPYFTTNSGHLVAHNNPVPDVMTNGAAPTPIKDFLAKSALVDRFMWAFFLDDWLSSSRSTFTKANVDPVEVTCLLLRRLKGETDAADVRLLLYLQFAGSHVIGQSKPPGQAVLVHECAQSAGIQVVDEFDDLKSAAAAGIEKLRARYVIEPDGATGHKSPAGNLQVAKLIEAALATPASTGQVPSQPEEDPVDEAPLPTDGHNLVLASEDLVRVIPNAPHFELRNVTGWFAKHKTYRLAAAGAEGEHYADIHALPVNQGTFVAAMEVKPEGTSRYRVQLQSQDGYGLYTDFDLKEATAVNGRFSTTRRIASSIEPLPDGWFKIWLRASLPASSTTATLVMEVADAEGNVVFAPRHQSILLRNVQLARGRDVVPYEPTYGAQNSK
jgi:hypothetical protein